MTILWSNLSKYMVSTWRYLETHFDVDLRVVALDERAQINTNFSVASLSKELDDLVTLKSWKWKSAKPVLRKAIEDADVVFVSGWWSPAYRKLVAEAKRAKTPPRFVLAMDNPWRGDVRQWLGRLRLARFLSAFERVLVPGERARLFARHLGYSSDEIQLGLYGVDVDEFARAASHRSERWPERFIFVGQLCERKGFDLLLSAYANYRTQSRNPWTLAVAGDGPMRTAVRERRGVEYLGFVSPDELPMELTKSGALILPSRYDAWPLVVLEAAAAALPIAASVNCGSTVEIVRDLHNGLVVSPEGASIEDALSWFDRHVSELRKLGRRSQCLARGYDVSVCAARWYATIADGAPLASTRL